MKVTKVVNKQFPLTSFTITLEKPEEMIDLCVMLNYAPLLNSVKHIDLRKIRDEMGLDINNYAPAWKDFLEIILRPTLNQR